MKNKNNIILTITIFTILAILLCVSWLTFDPANTTDTAASSSQSTTQKKKETWVSPYKSYDEGYEDVYENDDYDWDRYMTDPDYAEGVDDALDEPDW